MSDPGCSRSGCGKPARFGVVLLLVPSRDYLGKPWRFRVSATVCAEHREKNAEMYLTEALWKQVLDFFDAKGIARPHRTSTRLDFVSLLFGDDEAN